MWAIGWRDRIWSNLDRPWDLIVIGGGITGAGILREASRAGLRTLLLEAHDFASGTSSRSSKLVHGGFRYLKNAQLTLTLRSVRERERLLREGRGLITQLGFLLTSFSGDKLPTWLFGAGLTLYDLLAFKWSHRYYDSQGILDLCPQLCNPNLVGGYRYFDAQTDDARLAIRLIREGVTDGGLALDYSRVEGLLRDRAGQVRGVIVRDVAPGACGRTAEVLGTVIINATGAWADDLRSDALNQDGILRNRRLRKLRGSHLVFPEEKLPLTRAVSLFHPKDGRPVFAFPWEGVTIIGTTDIDQGSELPVDPQINAQEVGYLMQAVHLAFPQANLKIEDVQSSFSGIRAVVDTGKSDPSKESREHVLWLENGLLTVTGGKLTTFRLTAHDALQRVRVKLPNHPRFDPDLPVLDPVSEELLDDTPLHPELRWRLLGRYGHDAPKLVAAAQPGELKQIDTTPHIWAELRWAACAEGVIHLDDLLLRRVRLGITLPQGGLPWIEQIRAIVQPELGWDDARWVAEVSDYQDLWHRSYSI